MALFLELINLPPSPFEPSPLLYRLFSSPTKLITQILYSFIVLLRGPAICKPPPSSRIRLICISDTHTHKPSLLPPGDVLIHAGDLTNTGTVTEIQDQVDWLSSLPYEHKIVIAGNHDSFCDPRSRSKDDVGKKVDWKGLQYLQHSTAKLTFPKRGNRQVLFYGAPQIPQCGGEDFAFQYDRNEDAWSSTIPLETDVLITHTPPRHHLDLPAGLGCDFLLNEVWEVRPKVHVFGHVHAGYGQEIITWDYGQLIYERLCGRGEEGFMRDMVAIGAWIDVVRLAMHGVLGILWHRVWQGDGETTLMINAALVYKSTGKLGNAPQAVDI